MHHTKDRRMYERYQAIQRTCFRKEHQRIIPIYGKHEGVKLIGALKYETGKVLCTEEEAYDAPAFLWFLVRILRQYPSGRTGLVLDNAPIHHAKLIQPFLEKYKDQLQLVSLPPYSLKYNLIEGLWKWL